MARHRHIAILGAQISKQPAQRLVLGRREVVCEGIRFRRTMPAEKADPDGAAIVLLHMRAVLFNRSALGNRAVPVNQEVIADIAPLPIIHMPAPDFCDLFRCALAKPPIGPRSRAVHDDARDPSHSLDLLVTIATHRTGVSGMPNKSMR